MSPHYPLFLLTIAHGGSLYSVVVRARNFAFIFVSFVDPLAAGVGAEVCWGLLVALFLRGFVL